LGGSRNGAGSTPASFSGFLFMAKDPAFLFYSSDFIVGTMTMTMEDRGKYITILCLMHQQGRLLEETISLLVGSVSVNLKSKFGIDENGFWFNQRLEDEIEKRSNFIESRRQNGSKGGRRKLDKALGLPNGIAKNNHTEDENENEDENETKIGGAGERFPKAGTFNHNLPEVTADTVKQLVKITKGIDVAIEDIFAVWELFKIQFLTGKNFYASPEKVFNHFQNWAKLQNFTKKKANRWD